MERLCLFSHNRFHNLRNIHIMIVLLRIELAVSVLIDKNLPGFMDVRYILRQMRMVSASSNAGTPSMKTGGRPASLILSWSRPDTEPQSLRASRCPSLKADGEEFFFVYKFFGVALGTDIAGNSRFAQNTPAPPQLAVMVLNLSSVPAVKSIQSEPMRVNGLKFNSSGFISLKLIEKSFLSCLN